jgi:hypothetical protein
VNKLCFACLTLAAFAWTTGCSQNGPAPAKVEHAHDHEHEGHAHEHGEHGPHEGDLIELGGGKYHAEVVHDDDTKLVTIYLLAEDAKSPTAIAEDSLVIHAVVDGRPQKFVLPAKPQEGDAEGQTSRFETADGALVAALDNAASKANFSVTIAGRPYAGSIEAHDHEHGHK